MKTIDLNCDLGEGAGHDGELMPWVTSVNIACGGHVGDRASMEEAVQLAKKHGVAVGAHPSFEDREHFGRRELAVEGREIEAMVAEQIIALVTVATLAGGRVGHVKPHGALYNRAACDRECADAVARAVARVDRSLVLVGLAGSELIAAGQRAHLRVAREAFADRGYTASGLLVERGKPGSLIANADEWVRRVIGIVGAREVVANDGSCLTVEADTICLHGDGDRVFENLRALRKGLDAAGIVVRAFERS